MLPKAGTFGIEVIIRNTGPLLQGTVEQRRRQNLDSSQIENSVEERDVMD